MKVSRCKPSVPQGKLLAAHVALQNTACVGFHCDHFAALESFGHNADICRHCMLHAGPESYGCDADVCGHCVLLTAPVSYLHSADVGFQGKQHIFPSFDSLLVPLPCLPLIHTQPHFPA